MAHVRYEAGNEHNPTDPVGRVTVEIESDGQLRIAHHSWDGDAAWTARVGFGFLADLTAALRVAGFPAAPHNIFMPDERLRNLRVDEPAGSVRLPWYEVEELPGYAEAFALLDGLVAQVTGLKFRVGRLEPPATHVVRVS